MAAYSIPSIAYSNIPSGPYIPDVTGAFVPAQTAQSQDLASSTPNLSSPTTTDASILSETPLSSTTLSSVSSSSSTLASSTTRASISSLASSSSASHTPKASAGPHSLNASSKIGIGLGVPLFVILAAVTVAAVCRFRRYKRESRLAHQNNLKETTAHEGGEFGVNGDRDIGNAIAEVHGIDVPLTSKELLGSPGVPRQELSSQDDGLRTEGSCYS